MRLGNRKRWAVTALAALLLSSGCARTEELPLQTERPVNQTLKDLNSVDFSEFTQEDSEIQTTAEFPTGWSPKGNYTYVLTGQVGADGYQSALIRVDSADFDKGTAAVSYVFGREDGTTENSNGLLQCPMSVTDHPDGTREIRIQIKDAMILELKGTVQSRTAAFICNDVRYSLKKEG